MPGLVVLLIPAQVGRGPLRDDARVVEQINVRDHQVNEALSLLRSKALEWLSDETVGVSLDLPSLGSPWRSEGAVGVQPAPFHQLRHAYIPLFGRPTPDWQNRGLIPMSVCRHERVRLDSVDLRCGQGDSVAISPVLSQQRRIGHPKALLADK